MNIEAYIGSMLFSCFSLLSDLWGFSNTYPSGFTYMQKGEDGKFERYSFRGLEMSLDPEKLE